MLLWRRFGITHPSEIDLDAIAFDLGLIVRRRGLDGADARLVAFGDRGVITVSTTSHPKRQRFSIGHEIGHWLQDRNGDGLLSCSSADVSARNQKARSKEADANVFSADLLLPPYLVAPIVGGRKPSVALCLELSDTFDTSIPAAAIRLVRLAGDPTAVVVHHAAGKEWWFENKWWPSEFQLVQQVHHDSPTMELLYRGAPGATTRPQKEPGARWLWGKDAYRSEVEVQSIKRDDGRVLTLLRMIAARG
jgi:Zn-dependent peptidase ImmA (M78 family)